MDTPIELCIFDESTLTDLDSDLSRRRSFITATRGRETNSKRKTFWGQMPLSPYIDEQMSSIKDSLSPSPGENNKAIEDQNRNPNISARKSPTTNENDVVASPSNDLRVLMSPIKGSTPKSLTGSSRKSIRITPTPHKLRESAGYFTAPGSSMRQNTSGDNCRVSIFGRTSTDSIFSSSFLNSQRKSSELLTSKSQKLENLELSLRKSAEEAAQLKTDLELALNEKGAILVKYISLEERFNLSLSESAAFYKEIQAQQFLNSILEQKVEELECQISSDRLNRNESLSNKTRKYKQEIEKLTSERKLYEERANAMCLQMTEQMTLLQSTAMVRIEVSYANSR